MKPKIYVTRMLPKPAMDKLDEVFDVEVNPEDRVLRKQEIIDHVKDKDALLCLLTDAIDRDVVEANPNLKVISNYAVGYNNIQVDVATEHKIPVCFTPGVLTDTTADFAWALLMAVSRRVVESDTYLRAGHFKGWGPLHFLGGDVYGKTLGIVGMGRIGLATARRAIGFDMEILYTNRNPVEVEDLPNARQVELDELLQKSDFVSLHVALTEETRHLIGERELGLMKESAYLINTARGPVVDEKALVQALKAKTIAGAGLDVYEREPELEPGLATCENAVLAPHIASATIETRTKMGMLAAENAIRVVQGEAPHAVVNGEVLAVNQ